MSKLPEEWEEVKLSELGSFSKGKGISKSEIIDNGLPCIRYAEIYTDYDFVIKDFKSFISEEVAKNSVELKQNDILFAGSGETVEDIGKSVAFINNCKAFVGGDTIVFTPKKNLLNSVFMSYQLNNNASRKQLRKLAQGNSVVHIYSKGLMTLKVNFPPLEEQKKIAEILSTVDQKIAFVEENISQTEELKKGLRQELFCNGIGHSDFNDTEFGKRPESWKIEKLGDLTSLTVGGTPSTKIEEYWTPQEVPWLSSGEVNKKIVFDTDNMISEEGLNNSAAKLVSKNSVLMGLAGQGKTRGTVAITETELSTNQSVASILPSEDLDMYFIYHNLDSRYEEIRAMSTGVGGRSGLNLAILRSIKIALPPLEEQKQIANILKIVDQKLEVLKDKKESFEKLKKGLMQKLLTGEVRV